MHVVIDLADPADPSRNLSILFFMATLLLAIDLGAPCIGIYSHIFHPVVDPLALGAPSVSHLGGGDSPTLSKESIYRLLAQSGGNLGPSEGSSIDSA